MKFVILVHSNPQPWGHPTGDYVAEHQALPKAQRDQLTAEFEALLTQMQRDGELLWGEALGDPATSKLLLVECRQAHPQLTGPTRSRRSSSPDSS